MTSLMIKGFDNLVFQRAKALYTIGTNWRNRKKLQAEIEYTHVFWINTIVTSLKSNEFILKPANLSDQCTLVPTQH